MSAADWDFLTSSAEMFGVRLDARQVQSLQRYLELLCEWNQRLNLTAIEDPREILVKHFLDSLSCALVLDLSAQHSLADVGTGAGFPGLVLKIAFPSLRVTLLDAVQKRLNFLGRLAADLELEGVELVHARAEDAAAPRRRAGRSTPAPAPLRERFDVVTARAVARMNVLAEWTLPLARPGGHVIAMKGPEVAAELAEAARALSLLGGGTPETRVLQLPGTEIGRSLVLIPKVRPTPDAYPRLPGTARKAPL